MIEKIKSYLIQVALAKYLPMAGMAAVTALAGLFAAHSGMLEQYGITYGTWPLQWDTPPSGPVIVIELATLSAKAIAALAAVITAMLAAAQHHTTGQPVQTVKPVGAPPEGVI